MPQLDVASPQDRLLASVRATPWARLRNENENGSDPDCSRDHNPYSSEEVSNAFLLSLTLPPRSNPISLTRIVSPTFAIS
jgi:hypothetical protein